MRLASLDGMHGHDMHHHVSRAHSHVHKTISSTSSFRHQSSCHACIPIRPTTILVAFMATHRTSTPSLPQPSHSHWSYHRALSFSHGPAMGSCTIPVAHTTLSPATIKPSTLALTATCACMHHAHTHRSPPTRRFPMLSGKLCSWLFISTLQRQSHHSVHTWGCMRMRACRCHTSRHACIRQAPSKRPCMHDV